MRFEVTGPLGVYVNKRIYGPGDEFEARSVPAHLLEGGYVARAVRAVPVAPDVEDAE